MDSYYFILLKNHVFDGLYETPYKSAILSDFKQAGKYIAWHRATNN